ncbi:heat-inducible transcription repressor [Streptococcus pneumoniae]|nr:heat-inducible transcription repressor [Streptococcus pneumoniae]
MTAFDIVVFGATYSLGGIYPRRVANGYLVSSDSKELLAGGFAETEEHHSGTFPRSHRFRYSLQDSDGIPQIIQRYFTTTDNVIDLFEHILRKCSTKTL